MIWRNLNSPCQSGWCDKAWWKFSIKSQHRGDWANQHEPTIVLEWLEERSKSQQRRTFLFNLTRLNIKAFMLSYSLDLWTTNIICPRLHTDSFSRKHDLLNLRKWFQDKYAAAARLDIQHGREIYNHFLHLYLISLTTSTNHFEMDRISVLSQLR